MTIMDHRFLPVRAEGVVQDISDLIADSFLLAGPVDEFAGLGVQIAIVIEAGAVSANVTLDRRTVNLLPALAAYFGAPGLTYPEPGTARAVGSMGEGRISVTITAPDPAQATSPQLRAAIDQALTPAARTAPGWVA
ncbi:hypothetical protein QZH56_37040 (plasmid) [Streptomyces olivoreticuli]|uniref:hypothetical protein n=1 Tax=Streptomyces olivoreticuli TaxID=68246 RepID=UPI0026581C23|nr:hypothetical protein [Streptomyces olivoreticuli]WKK27859.1 hypothetical protein QZH56_37040 [Streptomyces olivoreticuli]